MNSPFRIGLRSILVCEQDAGAGSVGLGDDPDFRLVGEFVGGEQPALVLEVGVVGLPVGAADRSPIAALVAGEELGWGFARSLHGGQGTWCGDGLAQRKLGFFSDGGGEIHHGRLGSVTAIRAQRDWRREGSVAP